MPADGEVAGLLALMLLTEARRTARVSASGELVALDEQDRGTWDGSQVLALYDQLVRRDSSLIIALDRAVAVAELDGPEVVLAAVDRLEDQLAGYHACHATRADLLRRLGRRQKSRAAYDKAIEPAGNTAEIACLTRRRDQRGQRPRIRLLESSQRQDHVLRCLS